MGKMCSSMTAKSAADRRGDIHLIGEKYFWTGKPNEGSNMSIANMLRAHTEYKIARGWRRRDPVSGKWSDIMKKGCADLQIWDDTNEQGSIAEDFEVIEMESAVTVTPEFDSNAPTRDRTALRLAEQLFVKRLHCDSAATRPEPGYVAARACSLSSSNVRSSYAPSRADAG